MLAETLIRPSLARSLFLAGCVMMPGSVSAVTYSGSVYAQWEVDQYEHIFFGANTVSVLEFSGTYQPRSGQGLVGVSASVDVLGRGSSSGNASVAVYGTDSTRSNVGSLDPSLIASGIGVEPMVDIQTSATAGEFFEGIMRFPDGAGSAEATISVLHRVTLNPEITIPESILGSVLSQLNNVPLQVLWAYDVVGFGGASANFDLSVTSATGDCASGIGGMCGGFQFLNLLPDSHNSGSTPFTAVASRTGREATYDITLHAVGSAWTFDGVASSSELQAVIDPYLTVDPSWEYAEYFKVQQESTLNPGEWVGITRNYLNPVPVPPAVWLFGSGLIGLIGIARRKKI